MSQSTTTVRVVIINDYPVVVAGLAALLEPYAGRITLARATTQLTDLPDADVILFDTFGDPSMGDRLSAILRSTSAKVLIFSWAPSHGRDPMSDAGRTTRFLFKGSSAAEIVDAVEAVAGGDDMLSTSLRVDTEAGDWPGKAQGLSSREAEIISLIVAGWSNQDIAQQMFLSVNTVKTHIRSGYRKMKVRSRAQAVLWGIQHGFHGPKR